MADTYVNRVRVSVSGTPGTGTVTLGSAASGWADLGAAHDGLMFSVLFKDGISWEIATACVYGHAARSLTRGTLESSSSGSRVSLTSSATVHLIIPASAGNAWAALPNDQLTTQSEMRAGVEALPRRMSPAQVVDSVRYNSSQHWGNAANQAAMVALNQATQWDTVRRTDTGTDWRLTGTDPAVAGNWTNLGGGSGALTVESVSSSRAVTAADDGKILQCSAGITLTLPAGLSPRPRFGVEFDSGTITIAVSGGATANGATSSVTRSITYNPAGFAVIPRAGSDGYGVSGA